MSHESHSRPSLSVSELNREAKRLLESHFDWVWVEGEIGNFTAASSGHWDFSLKDADAQVRCAMFRRANSRVKIRPNQGDSVRIRAKVSLYEGRGEFQLICEHLEPAGAAPTPGSTSSPSQCRGTVPPNRLSPRSIRPITWRAGVNWPSMS